MNKIVLGLLAGALLGAIDGGTAWFTPAVRPAIVLGILFGLAVGFVLAFLIARLQHGYYFEIILPGSIVGGLVGWATQRYGTPAAATAPAR